MGSMNWEKNRTHRKFQRARLEQPQWNRPKRLTPGSVEALEFLRACDPGSSNFLQDLQAKALADPVWTPTIRQERVILKIRAEREQRPS